MESRATALLVIESWRGKAGEVLTRRCSDGSLYLAVARCRRLREGGEGRLAPPGTMWDELRPARTLIQTTCPELVTGALHGHITGAEEVAGLQRS